MRTITYAMLAVSKFLLLFLNAAAVAAAPGRAAARPIAVGSHIIFNLAFPPPSASGSDVTQNLNRRVQVGAGPYTGITVQGPSGGIVTGNGGGYGPGAYVNQGSSGTIVTANAGSDTVVPIQLEFAGLPFGYQLSASIQQSTISYMWQILQNSLDPAFRLIDVSYDEIFAQNSGQNGGQNINWQGGVQNQNGQIAWNNQNSGGNGWQGGVQNQNGQTAWNNQNSGGNNWQNGQNGVQNQNGQTAWNIQNGAGNNWLNGQNGVQNQNGQTSWNNQNGNGAGTTDIFWAVNGQNVGQNGQNGGQNQSGQTAWNNQNGNGGNGVNGSGAGIDWAGNGSGNGVDWNNNGVQGSGESTVSLRFLVTVNSASNISTSASSYVVQALLNNVQVIMNHVRSLDSNAFANVRTTIEIYEFTSLQLQPTPEPPTIENAKKTVPMQFNLDNIAASYLPSVDDQESIYSFFEDMIRDNLDPSLGLELSDFSYTIYESTGSYRRLAATGRSQDMETSMYLPVDVTLKGSSKVIDDAYLNLLDIAEEHAEEVIDKLKEMDPETFEDVEVSSEAFDVVDVNSDTKTVSHPVQFVFNKVEEGYELSKEDQTSFIGSMKELLNENLDINFELIHVAYASRFKLDVPEPQLPVRVTVRGPSEESDQSLSHIMKILEGLNQDIVEKLQSLDPKAFEYVRVSIGSADLPDVAVPTFVTEHPVQVIIQNVQPGYVFSAKVLMTILDYVKELVSENLDDRLELVDVEYEAEVGPGSGPNSMSLPFRITVRGDSEATGSTMLSVIKIVQDMDLASFLDIEDYLNVMDDDEPAEEVYNENTDHYVQFLFKNAPDGHRLSAADRASLIRFVKILLDKNLEEPLELVRVAYAGNTGAHSLPLRITVKGPADEVDFALAFVMDILQDNREDIEMLAKSQDWNELKDTRVVIESFDPALLTDEPEVEMVEMKETEHPVQLIFDNVPPESSLSQDDRASIVDYVKKLMEDDLANPFQLVEVTDESREMDTLSVPLRVAVIGPAPKSELAPAYVMKVFDDNEEDLENMLKGLDWVTFKDANIRFETDHNYVPPSISEMEMEEMTYPVRFNLNGVSAGYTFSQSDKESIVGFSEQLLDENLNKLFQRVEVADVSNGRNRLDTVSLPLLVTVKGPADKADLAPAYVMEVFENHKGDLEKMLQTLDWNTFKNVEVRIGTDGDDAIPITTSVMEDTVHPIQFNLENVPSGYTLSRKDTAHIERFTKELLANNLNDPLKLVEVAHAVNCYDRNLHSSRRLDTTSLPLRITVRGPTDVSDFALSYVMDVLDEYNQDLVRMLKTLDWVVFDAVNVSLDTHDLKCSNEPMEETSHPVQFNFENLPAGYPLYQNDASYIIPFVKKLVGDDIDDSFELIEVADDMKRRSLFSSLSRNKRRLDTVSLPLLFTVNGPVDQSDSAPDYVLQAIRDNLEEIEEYLKSLDSVTFKNVIVTIGPYNDIDDSIGVMDEDDGNTPWWVGVFVGVGLLIFICCCCCMCCFVCRRYKNDKKVFKESKEDILEFTGNIGSDADATAVPANDQNQTDLFSCSPHKIEDEHRGKILQVMPSDLSARISNVSFDEHSFRFFDDSSTAIVHKSTIAFGLDTPSENNLKIASIKPHLATLPPTKELCVVSRCQDTGAQSTITSVIPDHTSTSENPSVLEVYRDSEDQSIAVQEPIPCFWDEENPCETQPNVIHPVASTNMDPNALVLFEDSDNHRTDVEEPSGKYYFDEQLSYSTESQSHNVEELGGPPRREGEVQSFVTQSPSKFWAAPITSVASPVQSEVRGGAKKKRWRNDNMRRTMDHIHMDEEQLFTTQSQCHHDQDRQGMHEEESESSSFVTRPPPTCNQSFFV